MQYELKPGKLDWFSTFRLAWRNLARNRRRTLLTAVTVAFAVMLLQLGWSLLEGFERQSFDNLINYQTAHAKLFAQGYFDKREDYPLDYNLSELSALERTVEDVNGVAASTPRLVFSAQVSDGVDQIPCIGTGIQVSGGDTDVFRISETITAGRYLESGEEAMLMGGGLADMFGVELGQWLTVLAKTKDGAYEALDLPIVGIVGTGNPVIDQGTILIPLDLARRMLDMEESATEMSIRFSQGISESATLRRLVSTVEASDGVEIRGWKEIEEDFMALVRTKRTGQTIAMSIFIILAIVGVTNTILMATFERTREIGTVMALGLRGSGIRRLFLVEGALTGLIGGGIGTVFGLIFVGIMAVRGWDISAMYGDLDIGYPIKDVIYFPIQIGMFVLTWFTTALLAALAAYYPANRASRQQPVEALRHV
jgi:ABC-type lipoprotein release transport system permease subunit